MEKHDARTCIPDCRIKLNTCHWCVKLAPLEKGHACTTWVPDASNDFHRSFDSTIRVIWNSSKCFWKVKPLVEGEPKTAPCCASLQLFSWADDTFWDDSRRGPIKFSFCLQLLKESPPSPAPKGMSTQAFDIYDWQRTSTWRLYNWTWLTTVWEDEWGHQSKFTTGLLLQVSVVLLLKANAAAPESKKTIFPYRMQSHLQTAGITKVVLLPNKALESWTQTRFIGPHYNIVWFTSLLFWCPPLSLPSDALEPVLTEYTWKAALPWPFSVILWANLLSLDAFCLKHLAKEAKHPVCRTSQGPSSRRIKFLLSLFAAIQPANTVKCWNDQTCRNSECGKTRLRDQIFGKDVDLTSAKGNGTIRSVHAYLLPIMQILALLEAKTCMPI